MDTALFYPTHLNLSPKNARSEVDPLVENARRYGGVLTLNWHDRSIAPERLWGDSYRELLDHLKKSGGWFATAHQSIAWFQKRRSATFRSITGPTGQTRVEVSLTNKNDNLPGLRLRIHESDKKSVDTFFNESTEVELPSVRNP